MTMLSEDTRHFLKHKMHECEAQRLEIETLQRDMQSAEQVAAK